MSNFVRRIVSGNKARFKDAHLDMELDLVYVTDNIIVMGFPATGVEGFYRNRREDAKKFLDHRHGKDYWVFNFCPTRENSYPASYFDGRVSRYPFPDHHAPPLAILPLFVREARQWLSGSEDRVAVLHCKAGKGRSGTLACSYLLSLDESPTAPKLQRSMTKKEWAERRADMAMAIVDTEDMKDNATVTGDSHIIEEKSEPPSVPKYPDSRKESRSGDSKETADNKAYGKTSSIITGEPTTETPSSVTPPKRSVAEDAAGTIELKGEARGQTITLENVLALHTSRRMKAPPAIGNSSHEQGVSIPSQRRWLHYWSLLLAHAGPLSFWGLDPVAPAVRMQRIRLREIRVRMRELGGVKAGLLKLANDRGKGLMWVSLARYDDAFIETLEGWEKCTRDEDGHMGEHQCRAERMACETINNNIFKDGKWDKKKMIRSFTRLGNVERAEDGETTIHSLRPLSDRKWEVLQEQIARRRPSGPSSAESAESAATSIASSVTDLAQMADDGDDAGADHDCGQGVVLDATREVRAKLYIGQVFFGWFWFIPAFHMLPPLSPSQLDADKREGQPPVHFVLERKEIDFPIGIGAALVDVDIVLEWVGSASNKGIGYTQSTDGSAHAESSGADRETAEASG